MPIRISLMTIAAVGLALSACQEQKPLKHEAYPAKHEIAAIFGVRMGDPISALPGSKLLKQENSFGVPQANYGFSPNEPNARFETYEVLATKQHGACRIVAIQRHASPAVRSEVERALKEKYGAPWENVAYGSSHWWPGRDHPEGSAATIDQVMLMYLPYEDNSDGEMTIRYAFQNLTLCEKDFESAGL